MSCSLIGQFKHEFYSYWFIKVKSSELSPFEGSSSQPIFWEEAALLLLVKTSGRSNPIEQALLSLIKTCCRSSPIG